MYLIFDILYDFSHPYTAELESDDLHLVNDQPEIQHGRRQKRATCDLLAFSPFKDTACAAHCIGLRRGFRGGYCTSKKVCHCRK